MPNTWWLMKIESDGKNSERNGWVHSNKRQEDYLQKKKEPCKKERAQTSQTNKF